MEATVQLNARMNRELKKAGDEALARIGLSPTEAVRALWTKAAKRGADLEEVAELLAPAEAAEEKRKLDADSPFAETWEMMDELYRQVGADPRQTRRQDEIDDKELLEEALYERMAERGLM